MWRWIEVAADFMSVVSTRLVRAASPARVGCSTRKGVLFITYGIAALERRCGHAEGSGTDSTRRFHEHAPGVGSRSLGSFTPSTSQGSRPGRTTLLPIVGTRSSPAHRLPIPVACREKPLAQPFWPSLSLRPGKPWLSAEPPSPVGRQSVTSFDSWHEA